MEFCYNSLNRTNIITEVEWLRSHEHYITGMPVMWLTEKWKSSSVMSNFVWSHGYRVHGILQARKLEWVAIPFSMGSCQHRDWTQVLNPGLPHCRQISLPAEPPGKPKNTGVGSLSLLQQILPDPGIKSGSPASQWPTEGQAKGAASEESDELWTQGVWETRLAPMLESPLEKQ